MRESVVSLRKFEFLVMPIENSVSAFSSWKAYNVSEINDRNKQALFSKTESFVVPAYKRYAYLSFNLKNYNFSVTTYYSVKTILIVLTKLKNLILNESKGDTLWIQ